MKLSDYKSEMPLINLLILVFLILPMSIMGQSEKPQTIVVPTGSLGEISEVRKKMLEMTLISNLDDHFAIVPKDLFEEAQEKAFEELDYEECTEEQCIMMIKEILQVENSFQLVVLAEDDVTQISVIWNDLDQKRVEEEFCEGCKTKELSKTIENLVQKLIGINKEIEIQDQQPKKLEPQKISVSEKLTEPTLEKFQSHEDQKIESKSISVSKKQSVSIQEKLESSSNTVIDSSTGLMWQFKPDRKTYDWQGANGYCDNLQLSGFSDWQLPEITLLEDMLDKKHMFHSYKQDLWYWSSSTFGQNEAWHTGSPFPPQKSREGYKSSSFNVRCVREIGFTEDIIDQQNTFNDPSTGLMWQKEIFSEYVNWWGAVEYCENLILDNYGDWSLPSKKDFPKNKEELSSKSKNPFISKFHNIQDSQLWIKEREGKSAWTVDYTLVSPDLFQLKDPFWEYKVRCVRKIKTSKEFKETNPSSKKSDSSSNTVIDPSTGLMWQKKPNKNRFNWNEAKNLCENLIFENYKDWFLPELEMLMEIKDKKNMFDSYGENFWYWSSTTYSQDEAWLLINKIKDHNIQISTRDSGHNKKMNYFYVRCVRRI